MPMRYEVMTKCPTTGKLVPTGVILKKDRFEDGEKPYGPYNCEACKDVHVWSYDDEDVQIVLRAE